jgi:lysyl-tRNA synthetase class I
MSSQTLREAAEASKAWPFEEARKLIARLERSPRSEVIFETGYGPSGLPHWVRVVARGQERRRAR